MIRPPADLFDEIPSCPGPPAGFFDDLPSCPAPNVRQREAAARVAALTDGKLERLKGPKRNFQLAPKAIAKARAEMDEMSDSGVWTSARGVHLVALYAWLHVAVYEVEPAELDGKAWALASSTAQKFVASQFGGDFAECVEFMRWAWKREALREEHRRAQKTGGSRISVWFQFSPALVTDYRIDVARRNHR